jgi:hypothetical protein
MGGSKVTLRCGILERSMAATGQKRRLSKGPYVSFRRQQTSGLFGNRREVPIGDIARVAVGTRVTARPPHRTVRAAFPHTAPTSGV